MLRLASDADVRGEIIRGVRRRLPEIDLVRVQDALPESAPDQDVLAWAAAENRVLITIGSAIDDIVLIVEYMSEAEIRSQIVVFLPLRG
jgi:hypothetical protein